MSCECCVPLLLCREAAFILAVVAFGCDLVLALDLFESPTSVVYLCVVKPLQTMLQTMHVLAVVAFACHGVRSMYRKNRVACPPNLPHEPGTRPHPLVLLSRHLPVFFFF